MKLKIKNKNKPITNEVHKLEEKNKPETEKVKNKNIKRKRSKIKVEENGVELESQPAKKPKKGKTVEYVKGNSNDKETPQKEKTIQSVKRKVDEEKSTEDEKIQSGKENTIDEKKQNKEISKSEQKKNLASIRKKSLLSPQMEAEREARTIFIGNLPVKFNKNKINKFVRQYGEIESTRIRGAIPECEKISKRVAVNKKMFNNNQNSLVAYVIFKSIKDAQNALALNGELFEERHLRVTPLKEKISDKNKGIFIGNLPYKITEEEMWDFFKDCGEISSVRIIRDNKTGLCKGFGYVNFKSEDSVEFALKLDEEKLQDREIRIKRLFSEGKLEKLKKKKQLTNTKTKSNQPNKKFKSMEEKTAHDKLGFNKRFQSKKEKKSNNSEFKKKKTNKIDIKKKKLAEKLLAKSKKKAVAL